MDDRARTMRALRSYWSCCSTTCREAFRACEAISVVSAFRRTLSGPAEAGHYQKSVLLLGPRQTGKTTLLQLPFLFFVVTSPPSPGATTAFSSRRARPSLTAGWISGGEPPNQEQDCR
jgi:hypothetical protein